MRNFQVDRMIAAVPGPKNTIKRKATREIFCIEANNGPDASRIADECKAAVEVLRGIPHRGVSLTIINQVKEYS